MVNDPISDMLARIRNAICARHDRTRVPSSRLKLRVAEILKKEGYISDVREEVDGHRKTLTLTLKWRKGFKNAIDGMRRVSKPGRRVYVGHDKIPYVYSGMGVAVLSTSNGVMSDHDARTKRVGGEVLFEVW